MRRDRVELSMALVLSALVAIPLLQLSFVPTMDGLHHLLHGVISNHMDDPERGYSRFLESGAPITSLGFGWLFQPLEFLVGWRSAYMFVLALIALGWSWSVRFLIHSVVGRPTPLGLLGFCFAFSWPLYMGFLPFCISGVLGVTAMGVTARTNVSGRVRYVLVAGLLLLSALAHVFPATLCGVAALSLSVARSDTPKKELWRLVACGVPAALIALLTLTSSSETLASRGMEQGAFFWSPLAVRLLDLGRTSIAGPAWRWAPLVACAVGGAIAALAQRSSRLAATAGALTIAFTLIALVSPLHMTAWEYFSPRPLLFAIALGTASLAALVPESGHRVQLAVSFCVAACSIQWAQSHNRSLDAAAEPALAGLDGDLKRDGWRLPINLDVYGGVSPNTVVYAKPLANIGFAYAAEQGGAIPYLFASSPSLHPSVFRAELGGISVPERSYFDALVSDEWRDPGRLHALRTSLLADGAAYQDVIIWGDRDLIALLPTRGFVVDYEDNLLALASFHGCPVEISANAPPGAEGLLQWGWFPLEEEAGRIATATSQEHPERQGAVITTPCGPTWIRLALRFDETTYVCEGSSPDGRLFVDIVPNQNIHCDLRVYEPPATNP